MNVVRTIACFFLLLAGVTAVVGCSSGAAVSGEDFQQVDLSQLSPDEQVIKAAAIGDVDKLNELLAEDPTLVQVQGPNGNTPLHAAAANGQDDVVEALLAAGADPTATNDDGHTAGAIAAQYDHLGTAKKIAEAVMAGAEAAP